MNMNYIELNNIRKLDEAALSDDDWQRIWTRVSMLPANFSEAGPSWRVARPQPHWRCALLLCWAAGGRLSEIFRAKPQEFDMANSLWIISPTDVREADRIVKLAPEVRAAVADALASPRPGRSFIFGDLARSEVGTGLRRLGLKAGVPRLTFTRIRAAAISRDSTALGIKAISEKYTRGKCRSDYALFLKKFARFRKGFE